MLWQDTFKDLLVEKVNAKGVDVSELSLGLDQVFEFQVFDILNNLRFLLHEKQNVKELLRVSIVKSLLKLDFLRLRVCKHRIKLRYEFFNVNELQHFFFAFW